MIRFLASNRMFLFAIAVVLQLAAIGGVLLWFNEFFVLFYGASILLSLVVVLWILNKRSKPAYKIAWLIPILLFPLFGGTFYLFWGSDRNARRVERRMRPLMMRYEKELEQEPGPAAQILAESPEGSVQSRYIYKYGHYPLYCNEGAEYLPGGEVKFQRLKEELRKAEHFIFLEYFIIEEGLMWNSILAILEEKVAAGVDVRVIYDDAGCAAKLPFGYHRTLEEKGIRCGVFHPLRPIVSSKANNRDHRKLAVIDGLVGFMGGINLADEYINEVERFGHWKDAAILVRGRCVRSLTVMFLTMWEYIKGSREDPDRFDPFGNEADAKRGGRPLLLEGGACEGFVQPFGDSPLDGEPVSQSVYLNLISKAKESICITSPYLILDDEMVTALTLAAKGGVDVRIITPSHPDKRYVHIVSRSYYPILMASGAKIYEYTPGFIHSKTMTVDGQYGLVGTINMDYRSLFLHYECAVWLCRCDCIQAIEEDFRRTMEVSRPIVVSDLHLSSWPVVLVRTILRVFAPLL